MNEFLATRSDAINAAKQLGRQLDDSREHNSYVVRDRSGYIELTLNEKVAASWIQTEKGWEREGE